jgi:hypothetical protein
MWTWWPTKRLASLVARTWAAMLRRFGRGTVEIEMETTNRPS